MSDLDLDALEAEYEQQKTWDDEFQHLTDWKVVLPLIQRLRNVEADVVLPLLQRLREAEAEIEKLRNGFDDGYNYAIQKLEKARE